jgi:hypothetical protein
MSWDRGALHILKNGVVEGLGVLIHFYFKFITLLLPGLSLIPASAGTLASDFALRARSDNVGGQSDPNLYRT